MRLSQIIAVLLLSLSSSLYAQDFGIELVDDTENILPKREQAILMNRLLKSKQEIVLPQVMRETEIDMWIVSRDEGHLYITLQESDKEGLISDRFSYLVFFDKGEREGIERIGCGDRDLAEIIKARNPKQIAVNSAGRRSGSGTFRGSQETELKQAIGEELASRIVNAGILTNRWLGTCTDEQMSVFKVVLRLAHEIIAEAYSNKVVIPDVTTTDDLNWWIRQRYADLGIGTHDHPTITIQRSKEEREKYDDDDEYFRIFDERFVDDPSPRCGLNIIIRRGDIIFCDTGIKYLGLYTDTQQAAYVLKEGETDVPEGIKEARRQVIRFQDILGEEMKEGRDGNEAGVAAVKRAAQEGIKAKLYSHSLAYYVMRYGMLGGIFSDEARFAGSGMSGSGRGGRGGRDNPIRCNTLFALEMDVEYDVPEWNGQRLVLFSETGMAFTKRGMEFPGGRETEWYVIK